jgi:hypothetical protein
MPYYYCIINGCTGTVTAVDPSGYVNVIWHIYTSVYCVSKFKIALSSKSSNKKLRKRIWIPWNHHIPNITMNIQVLISFGTYVFNITLVLKVIANNNCCIIFINNSNVTVNIQVSISVGTYAFNITLVLKVIANNNCCIIFINNSNVTVNIQVSISVGTYAFNITLVLKVIANNNCYIIFINNSNDYNTTNILKLLWSWL